MTEIVPAADGERALQAAVSALRDGRLIVIPTDTSYALAADAFQPLATRRMFDAKGRTRHVPLPILIRSPRQAIGLVEGIPEAAERLMASYWPGALTVILRAAEGLTWDLGETHGTVMLRMPADDFTTSLVQDIGPLACTAANRDGATPPRTAQEAAEQFGAAVALVIDGGLREGPLSTIVDVTGERPLVLREGAISAEAALDVATGAVGWGMRPDPTPAASRTVATEQEQ